MPRNTTLRLPLPGRRTTRTTKTTTTTTFTMELLLSMKFFFLLLLTMSPVSFFGNSHQTHAFVPQSITAGRYATPVLYLYAGSTSPGSSSPGSSSSSGTQLFRFRQREQQASTSSSSTTSTSSALPLTKRQRFRNWQKRRRDALFRRRQEDDSDGGLREGVDNHAASTTAKATSPSSSSPPLRQITTVEELDQYWDPDIDLKEPKVLLSTLEVKGDTQMIGRPLSANGDDSDDVFVHPVLQVLHDRRRRKEEDSDSSVNTQDSDTMTATSASEEPKIALVVEGGGMRGCTSAGMVAALYYLGLRDCFDVVYGSSAGSIIGAYFIAGQLPWFGPELYYDKLPTAGKSFIDTGRLLRALGLGLLNPRLVRDVVTRRNSGKPVLNLDFLLKDTLQSSKRLDWKTFQERQESGAQPLKVMASAMKAKKAMVMSYEAGHFSSLEELAQCMHASCLLPGITGPAMNIRTNGTAAHKPKFVLRNNLQDDDFEPLADSLIYAPIPYDVARQEGATHMVVLRSKPDGGDVTGKGGSIGERLTWSRFLLRKARLPNIYRYLRQQRHKRLYARSVLELNEAARPNTTSILPPTLTVALSEENSEVARLESRREAIFEGVRNGFARAYDALVEDPAERGKGHKVAMEFFPDEIMDYEPSEIAPSSSSAFKTYLTNSGIVPKAWEGYSEPPLKRQTTT